MIQRIQTVWLFLAVLFAALTYKFPFYNGPVTGKENVIKPDVDLLASSNLILIVLTAGLIAGTIAIIFMYKNRRMQRKLVYLVIILAIAAFL